MTCNLRKRPVCQAECVSPESENAAFARSLLGKPVTNAAQSAAASRAAQEGLQWLAEISSGHERQLLSPLRNAAEATAQREHSDWLAEISTVHEADWDPAKHPRRGTPPNAGWFASTGGSTGTKKPVSFADALAARNKAVGELTGGMTPELIRASRLAFDLQAALELPGDTARGAVAGLGTGGKAVVNGTATAVKNVATLGLSTSQLEPIGVAQADRDQGYDTAVAIATASGEVLIAVGTGGIASALSKGGTVARTNGDALVAFDAAGNAVGVVQGSYDAATSGVNVRNGAQVAAGVLGLGANAHAAKSLPTSRAHSRASTVDFRVGKHSEMPSPRPGQNSHHGVNKDDRHKGTGHSGFLLHSGMSPRLFGLMTVSGFSIQSCLHCAKGQLTAIVRNGAESLVRSAILNRRLIWPASSRR
jgi:hypothetical protein